jgi:hypothetical protein
MVMGDVLTLEKILKKSRVPIRYLPDIQKKNLATAEQTLKKIPKKTLPIEQHCREMARELYADSKYDRIDLSFLNTVSRSQEVDFRHDRISSELSAITIYSMTGPVFGLIDFEEEDGFLLAHSRTVGDSPLIKSYNIKISKPKDFTPEKIIEDARNAWEREKFLYTVPFSVVINYKRVSCPLHTARDFSKSYNNDNIRLNILPKSIAEDFPITFDGKLFFKENAWRSNTPTPADNKKSVESFMRRALKDSPYTFPDIISEPFTMQLPDDVRAEYNLTKKHGIFDRYLLLYETGKFSLKRAVQRRLVDNDPVLIGHLKSNNSFYIMKVFTPTIKEEMAVYANSRKTSN